MRYPIPFFAFIGIFLGVIVRFGWGQIQLSDWIWFITLIAGGFPIVLQTIQKMIQGQFAVDIIAMLAILVAFFSWQPFAGAVVVLMQSGGEAIEAYGMRRASSSLTALLQRAPRRALRKKENRLEDIPVEEVMVGDLLVIRPGDLVPVDGTIIEGCAEIDESALTGEPFAKSKGIEDLVFSGSVAINGIITIQANKISKESHYAKIVMMVKRAQEEKSPIQRLADRYAVFFTPLTLFIALIGFLITKEIATILSVLVVATPCPLILATPLAVICGMNRAADSGIIIKGGAAIEQVATTEIALFDKTGTITYGTPFVEKIVSFGNYTEDQLLYYAASIEQFSTHSIASAIVKRASELERSLSFAESFHEFPGQGVEGIVNQKQVVLGSRRFVEDRLSVSSHITEGKVSVFIGIDQKCEGILILNDHIRSEAHALIENLRKLGVKKIELLTGDNLKNAMEIAKEAGIKEVKADLLPEQKVEIVKKFKEHYKFVTMIGDGINDAPALASATVGIAMGAYGTSISIESADIVFLVDDLSKVSEVISIGKRMLFIAKQSIFLGMGLSLILMIIAVFGFIQPAIGAILQEFIDIAVILNALRARSFMQSRV